MMIIEHKCIKCKKSLTLTQKTNSRKYCEDCAKQAINERALKAYYKAKGTYTTGIRITFEQKKFLDEQSISLSKFIRNTIEKKMQENKS